MGLRLTDLGVLTLVALIITAWLAFMRSRLTAESNYPLVYWISILAYQRFVPEVVGPYMLYLGLVCSMLIRFEFMNEKVTNFFKSIEWIIFLFIIMRCFSYVLII